jgi:hypothetical protein
LIPEKVIPLNLNLVFNEDENYRYEERAAIMEYDGSMIREHAEKISYLEVLKMRYYKPDSLPEHVVNILEAIEIKQGIRT